MPNEESKTAVTAPPAGTGNVAGLGEAFNINLSTGQGMYTYKILLPDGVAGHTPALTLEYAHGAGLNLFGLGWRMIMRNISLRLDYGVPSNEVTENYMDTGNDILPLPNGTFGARIETTFNHYERVDDGWLIEERNGKTHELGLNEATRVHNPGHPDRVFEWLIERSKDPSGNTIDYSYIIDEGTAYPKEIRYAIYAIRFLYEDRPDVRSNGRTGFIRKCKKRCKKIELIIDSGLNERCIKSWTFKYTQSTKSNVSLLSSIQLISHGKTADGSEDVIRPPISFKYSPFELNRSKIKLMKNSDSLPPPPLTNPNVALVTMDDAPLPGILTISQGRQYYWRNLGDGTWATVAPLNRTPAVTSFANSGLVFIDMDASGTADLLVAKGASLPGYYENGGQKGWSRFVAFPRGHRSAPFWSSDNLRLSDINGDGRIDAIMSTQHSFAVWLNEGKEGWSEHFLISKTEEDIPDFSDPLVFLSDMNGDGLDDLVRVRSGLVEYWPGIGYGQFGEKQIMANSPHLQDLCPIPSFGRYPLNLLDVDGDGCCDLVRFTSSGIEVYLNQNGTNFSNKEVLTDIPPPLSGTLRVTNMTGGCGTGLLWNIQQNRRVGYVTLKFGSGYPAYLLSRIENGMGLTSEIFYRSAVEDFSLDRANGAKWNTNFPFPYLVVAGTRETDQVSKRETQTNYRYHDAHFEPNTRQFQGFKKTEKKDKGDNSRPDTLTVFHFLMGQEYLPNNGPEYSILNGMLCRTEIFGLDESNKQYLPYRIEESEYDFKILESSSRKLPRTYVFVKQHSVKDTDRTSDFRVEEKTYTYDDLGNVLKEVHRGYGQRNGIAQLQRTRTTEISYAKSQTDYIIDKMARITIRDENRKLLSEKRFYYDAPDFEGLPLGKVDHGNLARQEDWLLTENEFNNHYTEMNPLELGFNKSPNADNVVSIFVTQKRFKYDSHGLLLASRDPFDNEVGILYDQSGLFKKNLVDPLGNTHFEYDQATRQITKITYPNGVTTEFLYDAQGRPLKTALPGTDLNNAMTSYTYDENSIPNKRITTFKQNNGETSKGITYFDGYGKEFQQRVQFDETKFVVSGLKLYNPWGDLQEEYEPIFSQNEDFYFSSPQNSPSRRFFYDAIGRVIKTINFNEGISTAEYSPFQVILKDSNDNDSSADNISRGQFNTPHEEEFNVFRYLFKITEHLENNKQVVTKYETGPMGELLAVIDDQGEKFRYRYDHLGNRISIVIRESGERKIWYNANLKPVRTLDPQGHDLKATWDSLGRQTILKDGNNIIEEFHYDTNSQNALGRIAEVKYVGGRQVFIYDKAGRLLKREYHFDQEPNPFSLSYEYDQLGRELSIIHSDGTRIDRQLTYNGWLKSITNYIQKITHNPRGFPSEIEYQNGIKTCYEYTPGPGRISHQLTTSQNQTLENVIFTFDKMEMLISRNDASSITGKRDFTYDPLYQLTSMKGGENGNPIEHIYDYDMRYNLRRLGEAGTTLLYDDLIHPDRTSGLISDGNSPIQFSYDGNGNLLNLPGQQFEYNSKNELTKVIKSDGLTAEYNYDHLGFRTSKKITDKLGNVTRILYIGDQAEIHDGQPVYFVTAGPLRVAVIKNGTASYLHDNGLGSTGFITNATGQLISTIDFQPFGNVAKSTGSIDFRIFSLHPVDSESGLIYMRRRYYSPQLARFLTPDLMAIYQPEQFLHSPQSLHLYAFVTNNPLNKTDPTGMSFWSFLGAVVGVVVGIVVAVAIVAAVVVTGGLAGVLLGIGLALALSLAVVSVSYLIASNIDPMSGLGQFFRGFMIGFNAGMNGVLAGAIFGPVVGIAIGVVNFLATFDGIAQNSVYQGILGWSSWFMPMSWGATGLGLIFFTFNLVAAAVSDAESTKIEKVAIDWKTGSIAMVGGRIRNGTAFDMGNFVFLDPNHVGEYKTDTNGKRNYELDDTKYKETLAHEIGHTLSVAAFGTAFGICDLIGENLVGLGAEDYGEKIAESHSNRSRRSVIPMWG